MTKKFAHEVYLLIFWTSRYLNSILATIIINLRDRHCVLNCLFCCLRSFWLWYTYDARFDMTSIILLNIFKHRIDCHMTFFEVIYLIADFIVVICTCSGQLQTPSEFLDGLQAQRQSVKVKCIELINHKCKLYVYIVINGT